VTLSRKNTGGALYMKGYAHCYHSHLLGVAFVEVLSL